VAAARTSLSSETRVLAPAGRLDASYASRLGQDISALLADGDGRAIVNFSGVHYVSSSILRVLLRSHRRAHQAGGALALCCLQPQVLRVFEWVGFDKVLTIYGTEDDARKAMRDVTPRSAAGAQPQ